MVFQTPLGFAAAAWRRDKILTVVLPKKTRSAAEKSMKKGMPDLLPGSMDHPIVRDMIEYFSGERPDLSVYEVDLSGVAPFHRAAMLEARRVGYGEIATYGEIARRLGRPGAARAVGAAMARNPAAILIPCHRIVASGGSIGGFSAPGGIKYKKMLLEMEKAQSIR